MELTTKGGFETLDTVSTTVCQNSYRKQATLLGNAILPVRARVKNAVHMGVFPASGAYLPLKLYAITKQTRFILKSNINTENVDARNCLNERLSCTIAANFLEILAPVHTWRFNVSCFEVLDANKVQF